MKFLGNAAVFVILYMLFMLPTYYLPYLGSNSAVIGTLGAAANVGVNPAFWPHLGSSIILIVVAWFRGTLVNKKWLIIFPILAAVFDLAPGLSFIPLIPTVMHLLAIILGVIGATAKIVTQESLSQPLPEIIEKSQEHLSHPLPPDYKSKKIIAISLSSIMFGVILGSGSMIVFQKNSFLKPSSSEDSIIRFGAQSEIYEVIIRNNRVIGGFSSGSKRFEVWGGAKIDDRMHVIFRREDGDTGEYAWWSHDYRIVGNTVILETSVAKSGKVITNRNATYNIIAMK